MEFDYILVLLFLRLSPPLPLIFVVIQYICNHTLLLGSFSVSILGQHGTTRHSLTAVKSQEPSHHGTQFVSCQEELPVKCAVLELKTFETLIAA